ncbi:MAG: preprotein translocase subunit SecA, partial [Candidatus Brocadiia bacterium]
MSPLAEMLRRRRCQRDAQKAGRLEPETGELADAALPTRLARLRERRSRGAARDELLPQVFALVREACRRAIGIRQYDVQMVGGAALARGCVVEMATGEGKTFVAPLAAALYALDGRGVHVLTANDYLAGRDAELLEPAYRALGLSTGAVLADTPPAERERAYAADVTYTTVPQLGFDFLRQYFQQAPDALRRRDLWSYLHSEIKGDSQEERCLCGRHFAILDEVDSILIDYARRPLSISVQADSQRPVEVYHAARQFALNALQEDRHFEVDRIRRNVELTERGKREVGRLQSEYGYLRQMASEWEARVEEALSAELLFRRGEHYVLRGDQVILVDQTSGRLMIGQHLGRELHQALETKEGLQPSPRLQAAKSITVQALIRPYRHLAGMTGTAWEERREFRSVYDMPTVRFRPRLPLKRERQPDRIFPQSDQRWEAVAEEVAGAHAEGQPVLIGCRSVEKSRRLSEMLDEREVPHEVLNAVDHAREAEIIAGAGRRGAVTVATNMAGRGVEIKLGEGVAELGG